MTPRKFEDSVAPFEWIKKNGYYRVGSKYFVHKTFALIEASKSQDKIISPIWDFNSDVFASRNWQQTIDISLPDLYKKRAQQLRDKYDYLLIAFSGGADSATVIDSFINNNIHIDEIIIHWPKTLTDGKYQVSTNKSKFNVLSEWQLAAQPKLDYIQKHHPKIKITFSDLDDLDEEYNEDIFRVAANTLDFPNIKRQKSIYKRSNELMEQGFNVATVYGFDKPYLYEMEGHVFAGFLDQFTHVVSDQYSDISRNLEYFYWSPDLPDLAIRQAQILFEYLCQHPENLNLIPKRYMHAGTCRAQSLPTHYELEIMRTLTSQLLYPTWNNETFQADKPTDFIRCEHHEWIRELAPNAKFLQSHQTALQHQFNLIDSRFFKNQDQTSFTAYLSGNYLLGQV